MRELRQESYGSTLFNGSSETMPWQNLKASRASRFATQGRLGVSQAFNNLCLMETWLSPQVIRYGGKKHGNVAGDGAMCIPLERMQFTIQLDQTRKAIEPKPIPIIPERSFLIFSSFLSRRNFEPWSKKRCIGPLADELDAAAGVV